MLCRTAATRSVFRAISTSNPSIARSALSSTVFKAQLTSRARQSVLSRSPSFALTTYRKPVTTAVARYATAVASKEEISKKEKELVEDPDIDMMAGVRNDVAVIKDTFSLKDVPKEALYLGLAGVVPYAVTSLETVYLAWEMNNALTTGSGYYMSGQTAELLMGIIEPIQIGYGAVILSFLGAVHWGMEWAGYGGKVGYKRYAIGVVAPAVAWPTLLLPAEYALISQFFAFTFLYYNDARAAIKGWTPAWYSIYRFVLTFFVGTSIVLSLVGREQLASHYNSGHGLSDKVQAFQASREQDKAQIEAAKSAE